jgi:hypothetical protein
MEINNRTGKFSASRISELLAQGTGKTAQSYVLELALQMLGIKKDITTGDMLHGINNQMPAFQQVIKPLYNDAIWFDEYIVIDERCGASPDFMLVDNFVGDIKCPGYIDTYLQQIESMPKKYFLQVQMQMLAAKVDIGLLCFFLTKKEEWGDDIWEEYPMPLEDRYKIFEFKTDAESIDMIMGAVDKYEPEKQNLVQKLLGAVVVDEVEFFYNQINGAKYRQLKEASNIFNASNDLIRVKDKFYYKSK